MKPFKYHFDYEVKEIYVSFNGAGIFVSDWGGSWPTELNRYSDKEYPYNTEHQYAMRDAHAIVSKLAEVTGIDIWGEYNSFRVYRRVQHYRGMDMGYYVLCLPEELIGLLKANSKKEFVKMGLGGGESLD